jgi:hypothetical protein
LIRARRGGFGSRFRLIPFFNKLLVRLAQHFQRQAHFLAAFPDDGGIALGPQDFRFDRAPFGVGPDPRLKGHCDEQ